MTGEGNQAWTGSIRDFEIHLSAERNLSSHTRRAYVADVGQLQAFLEAGTPPAEVTSQHVRAFLADLHARRHPATLGRKLAALRTFFRYLVREGRCRLDPTAGMPTPRTPKRLPRPLAVDDCATLMEASKKGESPPDEKCLRDRALVEVLYGAGLRVGELASLDVRDVDLRRGDVRVWGKGGVERVVPLPAESRAALAAYLDARRSPGLLAQPLFTALRRRRDGPRRLGVRAIACATATRPTCSTWARTCARSRSCWATPASPPPRSTPPCRWSGWPRCTIAPTRGPTRRKAPTPARADRTTGGRPHDRRQG
jgi:integrase/recombinase XerC